MRIFTLLSAAFLASTTMMATEPLLSLDFTSKGTATESDYAKWTCVDANNDEKTWVYSDYAMPSRVYYSYHSTNAGDDWLFSPEITVPESGTYLIRFNLHGSSFGEAIEVWYGTSPTIEGMTSKGYENLAILGSPTPGYLIATLNAGDKIHIGFHAISQPDKYCLYLNSVEVKAISNPVDLSVTEILSPVSGEGLGQETVTVKVANLTPTDCEGFDISYTIDDGAPVTEHVDATLKGGETMEYTFATKADCSTPRGKYNLTVYTSDPNDVAPENDAANALIRHIAPAEVPYSNGFEPTDDTANFTYFNLNDDDGDWSVGVNSFFSSFSRTGDGYIAYNYNSQNAANDWFMLDPLEVEAGDYIIRFWYSATTNHPERLGVYWGTEATPEAMTNEICRIDPMTNDTFEESISIFNIPSAQKIFIGFYAYSDANENWMIIDDLSIDKVDPNVSDLIVGDISAPFEYLRKANKRDVVASVRNVSVKDAAATVSLYIDGTLVESIDATIGYMATKEFTFADALKGAANGKHTIKVEATTENDNNPSNNATERVVVVVEDEASILYDFEDQTFPEELTYRIEDFATIYDDVYYEDGVGFSTVDTHYLYGTGVLMLGTWFTDATVRADRFLVLPQVHLDDENCHLIWDASSFSTVDYETYDIQVSTSDDIWYNYTTIYSVAGEDEFAKTHGVSLEAYAGKDVYIAFHIKTVGGNALVLDNIGLYGNLSRLNTGVEDVAVDHTGLMFNGTEVVAGVEATITVASLDGSIVAQGVGESLNVAHLGAGVYVAKAVCGNSSAEVIKFVKR